MTNNLQQESWDLEISAGGKWFDLRLKELWHYRDLLLLLVRRDFVSFYKQTIFGPIWFFLQPVFTTIIFTFVFGKLAGIKTDDIPQPLFYLSGIVMWGYFSECLTKTSTVFRDNANIFGKVYFPRLIMPLSIVLSNLLRFAVQLLLFFIAMIVYRFSGAAFSINTYALLFPLLVVLMAMQGLGTGMIISSLTNKYRDLVFLLTFGVQLLMYASPVIYPLSTAPEKYRWIIELNPMTSVIECFRLGFLGNGTLTGFGIVYTVCFSVIILLLGSIVFTRVEKTFMDTV